MNLNELKNRAYKTAKAHGWHDKELSDETYLMLIITEIAEAVNADRAGKPTATSRSSARRTSLPRTKTIWKSAGRMLGSNS